MTTILYITRKGCHLCEEWQNEVKAVAARVGALFIEVNELAIMPIPNLFHIRFFPAIIIFKDDWPTAKIEGHDKKKFFDLLTKFLLK